MANEPVKQQKLGALIAGSGALVGIAAFLLLPYLTITLTLTQVGYNGTSTVPSYSQSFSVGTGLVTLFSGIIWVEALLAIAILVVAALVRLREAPFGNSAMPVATQLRRAAYTIAILGSVAILFQFLFVTIGNGQINQAMQPTTAGGSTGLGSIAELLLHSSSAAISVSLGYGIGSWIYLLSMGAVIFGGVQMLKAAGVTFSKPQVATQQQAWQQPSQLEQQNWQQPGSYPQQQTGPYPQQQFGSYPQQQGWQQPSQELPARPPTQDWQGWQQPPSRSL